LEFSAKYTPTNDFSVGGSLEYIQKKWPSNERYDFKMNFWIEKKF